MPARPKVLVSGCYDLLHAGHVTFFETAARYGDVYVCVGTDENVARLKGRAPHFTAAERLYMVESVRFVTHTRLSSGSGLLDFEPDMAELRPNYFVVNAEGGGLEKRRLCERYGVEYIELPRTPRPGLPARSSSGIKTALGFAHAAPPGKLPFRICLAGGWLDQPWVSKHHAGPVVVVNIHPTHDFNLRSGMATSTRALWQKLRRYDPFPDEPIELARLLFGYENPPGTRYVSGSQDHLGLTLPGVSRLHYEGEYWPAGIETIVDQPTCDWLEQSLALVELFERPPGYDPLAEQHITPSGVGRLARAGHLCWEAILARDIARLGQSLTATHRAWAEILPLTTSPAIEAEMLKYPAHGCITSGSGGGYLVLATADDVPGALRVKIRREPRV